MKKIIYSSSTNKGPDYERLKTLYSISQKLSTFRSIDESFSEILNSAAESFPLLSAVLIEHWEKTPRTAVWFSAGASKKTIAKALLNAKTSYSYSSGLSEERIKEFLIDLSFESELIRTDNTRDSDETNVDNYIILPLIIDDLPPLGALQLEGAIPLKEKDLEFVNALTNLVTVALDRFYKTKKERSFYLQEKQANQEVIKYSKNKVNDLENERALREDFVSLLTHDLKTPITVIQGAAELICKKKDSSESCLRLGGMIVKQSHHMVKMINDLLDANQIRSGRKLSINLEKVHLSSLVADVVSELKIVHGDRFVVVSDHSIEFSGDASGLRRILENLCTNAIKYGFPDTPVKIFLEEGQSDISIKVHNCGPVIPAEDQNNIFHQYHRTMEAKTGHREGWGIGLTLVRAVAEAHGGTVEVESSMGKGTIFIVKLPKNAHLLT